MSKNRPKTQPVDEIPDWQHLLRVGGLVAAVLGTLILGAMLRVVPADPGDIGRQHLMSAPGVDRSASPAEDAAGAAAAERSDPRPAMSRSTTAELGRRALDDVRHLAASRAEWTLKFMVTCQPEESASVSRAVRDLGADERLHFLPMQLDDRPCYRLCWGRYSSREAAAIATDVPPALREINPEPVPRLIAELLP